MANSGTLTVGTGCNFIVNGNLNNTGTAEVSGGTLTVNNSVAQLSGTTLTGGTWNARSNSTINITTGSNIITNQGDVTLDGLASTFTNINSLANNQGNFSVLNGRNFTTAGDNSGTVTVGSGSDLEVAGDLTGAGNLSVNGILTADSIVQNTLSIGAGAIVTIRPISGGPFAAQYQISPVPEPATITLLLLAGVGLGLWRSRRRDDGIQPKTYNLSKKISAKAAIIRE
ncbi:MAG: PEP-CTERM sorting domain-containing protein [Thermoguttaceae bacterium]